jgi:hypothetical protein
MQSDQPKSSFESEEKQKSAIQSEESSIAKSDHSEPIEGDDDNDNHKGASTNETIAKSKTSASSESDESKSSEEKRGHVKPDENIPKNVDV